MLLELGPLKRGAWGLRTPYSWQHRSQMARVWRSSGHLSSRCSGSRPSPSPRRGPRQTAFLPDFEEHSSAPTMIYSPPTTSDRADESDELRLMLVDDTDHIEMPISQLPRARRRPSFYGQPHDRLAGTRRIVATKLLALERPVAARPSFYAGAKVVVQRAVPSPLPSAVELPSLPGEEEELTGQRLLTGSPTSSCSRLHVDVKEEEISEPTSSSPLAGAQSCKGDVVGSGCSDTTGAATASELAVEDVEVPEAQPSLTGWPRLGKRKSWADSLEDSDDDECWGWGSLAGAKEPTTSGDSAEACALGSPRISEKAQDEGAAASSAPKDSLSIWPQL